LERKSVALLLQGVLHSFRQSTRERKGRALPEEEGQVLRVEKKKKDVYQRSQKGSSLMNLFRKGECHPIEEGRRSGRAL